MVSPATVRSRVPMPIRLGDVETVAEVVTFDGLVDGLEHLAIVLGSPGDVLGSRRCDCGPQLHEAVDRIEATGGSHALELGA